MNAAVPVSEPVIVHLVGTMDGDDACGGLNLYGAFTDPAVANQLVDDMVLAGFTDVQVFPMPLDTYGELGYGTWTFKPGRWEKGRTNPKFAPAPDGA